MSLYSTYIGTTDWQSILTALALGYGDLLKLGGSRAVAPMLSEQRLRLRI